MAWEELGTVAGRLLARLQTLQANDDERERPRLRLVMQPGKCRRSGEKTGALDSAPRDGIGENRRR